MHYRLYCLNQENRIVHATDLDAADDADAIAQSRAEGNDTDCELWCGTRRVARILASGEVHLSG